MSSTLRIITDQQQKIQELQMQKKMRELALEEKDVEIKQGNIELKRKKLELDSYKQKVNELENVTEADEFINCCPAQEHANIISMEEPCELKLPGGTGLTKFHATEEDMPRYGMVKTEGTRIPALTPETK